MSVYFPDFINNWQHNTDYDIRHSHLATKVHQFATSKEGKFVIGLGLGLFAHKVYGPLTTRVVEWLGVSVTDLPNPFAETPWLVKVILTPVICIFGPIVEEVTFRKNLQEKVKFFFTSFYQSHGFSENAAKQTARISSLFFTSVIFGLLHFSNALPFWCNPVVFVPQVVATTLMGFMFGLAKELTGKDTDDLAMPIGMHIGNNTLAWLHLLV